MSAIEPYVVNDETPANLKKLFIRFPCAINIYRNIVVGKNCAEDIFLESEETLTDDDPVISFVVEELCRFGLAKRDGDSIKNLYSDIVLVKNSFTREENRVYTCSLLKQSMASLLRPSGAQEYDVKNFHVVGTLSEEDFATMIEKVQTAMAETRTKPEGAVKLMATFVVKQF
jgi:hypothetical protein